MTAGPRSRAVPPGLGHTRDACLIEGDVEVLAAAAPPQERVTAPPRA